MAAETAFKSELVAVAKRQLAIAAPENIDDYHWSAIFISWCMRSAGANVTEFPPVQAHWEYVMRAMAASASLFVARSIANYAPQPGDVLHLNRDFGTITFERARMGHYPSEGGILVDVAVNNSSGEARFVFKNDYKGTVRR